MTDIESVKAFLNRVRDADKLIDLKRKRLWPDSKRNNAEVE